MPDDPALLARGPWRPTRSRPTGATSTTRRRRRARRRPTPRSPRCATAARRATTAWPPASWPTRSTTAGSRLDLQPLRWALRLVEGDASLSVAALCLTRDSRGPLAGRPARATWLSSWAGRWALGAGGAVDVGESPVDTLDPRAREEWSVAPERVRGRGAGAPPARPGDVRRPGVAARGAEVTPDHEHDAYAWWPATSPTGRRRPTSRCGEWPASADRVSLALSFTTRSSACRSRTRRST